MPAYRDNYPGRPRRMPERSGGRNRNYEEPYDRYDRERRPARRDYGYDARGREYDYSRRGYDRDSVRDQEYSPRQFRREQPGEYLADIGDDIYSSYGMIEEEASSSGNSSGYEFRSDTDDHFDDYEEYSAADVDDITDDFSDDLSDDFYDDFSDFDITDEDDEWVVQRETGRENPSVRRENDEMTAASRNGWSEQNGFDGFEDDEDLYQPSRANPSRHNGNVWFEDDGEPSGRIENPMRSPVKVTGVQQGQRRKGKAILIPICGILALIVVVAVSVVFFGGSKGITITLDSVLDTLVSSQTDIVIGGFLDKRINETQCDVLVDNKKATLKLSDCEINYVGKNADSRSSFVTGTNSETGEIERIEYAVSGALRYNKTSLKAFLDSLLNEGSTPVVDPYFEIDYENGVMTVYGGTDGWGIGTDEFLSRLCSALASSGSGNISVSCSSGPVQAKRVTADDIYQQAATRPIDAYTSTDSAGQTVYHSEINGIEFDKNELESAMAAGGSQWQIPVSVTVPQINLKDIKKYTFPDLLATYFTYYRVEEVNRSHNLALAAEHINSIILEPGQQFSFNDTVGERTAANGFKKAGVFAGEGNSEDYGGGICQTSSTLYYTCILANLQIDDRTNHMYTVPYMQTAGNRAKVFGNDATVNWGWTDFKFTNSKEYPIRIDFQAKGGILTCEIRGTADGYTADFAYETLETIPYKIKYLPAGTKDQAGKNGYRVNVYRIVYKDGEEIDRRLESKNTYKPMNQVFYTNDIPAGFEYGVEYDQDYIPEETTTNPEETTTTTPPVTE